MTYWAQVLLDRLWVGLGLEVCWARGDWLVHQPSRDEYVKFWRTCLAHSAENKRMLHHLGSPRYGRWTWKVLLRRTLLSWSVGHFIAQGTLEECCQSYRELNHVSVDCRSCARTGYLCRVAFFARLEFDGRYVFFYCCDYLKPNILKGRELNWFDCSKLS